MGLYREGAIPGADREQGALFLATLKLRSGASSHGWSMLESPVRSRSWRFEHEAVDMVLRLHGQWYGGELPGYPDSDAELWSQCRAAYAELREHADLIDSVAPGRERRGAEADVSYWIRLELDRSDHQLFDDWVDSRLSGFPLDDEPLLLAQADAELTLRRRPIPEASTPPPPHPTAHRLLARMRPSTQILVYKLFGDAPPARVDVLGADSSYEVLERIRGALIDQTLERGEPLDDAWDDDLSLAEAWAARFNEVEGIARIEHWILHERERAAARGTHLEPRAERVNVDASERLEHYERLHREWSANSPILLPQELHPLVTAYLDATGAVSPRLQQPQAPEVLAIAARRRQMERRLSSGSGSSD